MTRRKNTMRTKGGFTFIEMLCALVVLSLLTAFVATTSAAAVRIYKQEQASSEAELLASTINTALADPFRYMAQNSAGTNSITFNNNTISSPTLSLSDGRLYISGTTIQGTESFRLLNDGAYGDCTVSSLSLELDPAQEGADGIMGTYEITNESGDLVQSYDFDFVSVNIEAEIEKASS